MLNLFAKFLLISTSLSPILGAVAVNKIALEKPFTDWGPWVAVAVFLIVICWWLLRYAAKNVQKTTLRVAEFETNDREVLAFLLAYLLPIISSENMGFEGQWLTGAYILAVIFLVVAHAGALHFNPIMGLLGYHFYAVKNGDGVSQMLISRKVLRRPGEELETVMLADHIYLHTGNKDAS